MRAVAGRPIAGAVGVGTCERRAEPVRAETLDQFATMFEPCGFRREAFYPCYGMAEATLLAAVGAR